eukprot:36575_1
MDHPDPSPASSHPRERKTRKQRRNRCKTLRGRRLRREAAEQRRALEETDEFKIRQRMLAVERARAEVHERAHNEHMVELFKARAERLAEERKVRDQKRKRLEEILDEQRRQQEERETRKRERAEEVERKKLLLMQSHEASHLPVMMLPARPPDMRRRPTESSKESAHEGTEMDRDHCPFFFKVGACRFGARCRRCHDIPRAPTRTLLVRGMFEFPAENEFLADGKQSDEVVWVALYFVTIVSRCLVPARGL